MISFVPETNKKQRLWTKQRNRQPGRIPLPLDCTRAKDLFEDIVTQLDGKLSDGNLLEYLSEPYDFVRSNC